MSIRDVLVFVPVYRLEPETVESVLSLQWDGPLSWLFQRDNPLTEADVEDERVRGVRNHVHQYQRGRRAFLAGPYDAMLVIESDIIAPPDTLRRLAALDADVAYGAYIFRRSQTINLYEHYGDGARNPGEPLTYRPGAWQAALRAGKVRVAGAGLGCVLIKRHVLEAIDFRTLSAEMSPRVHCDSWFTADVYSAGFSQWADTRVICGHKDVDGTVLWPDGTVLWRS